MAEICPLLPEQARFLARNLAEEHFWNIGRLYRLDATLTPELIARAMRTVLNCHDGLRTTLRPSDRIEFGLVHPALDSLDVTIIDLSQLPASAQAQAITEHCTKLQTSMSMTEAPLCRVGYFILSDTERRLLLAVHHLVVDGLSFQILLEQLRRLCDQLLAGEQPSLAPPPVSASQYARWLRELATSDDLLGQLPLWRSVAREADPVRFDSDAENTFATEDTMTVSLDAAETATLLQDYLPSHHADAKQVFLAAAVSALHGRGRNRSLRVSMLGHGRHALPGQPNIARTVGWLATCYPVTVQLDTSADFSVQLAATGQQLNSIPYQGAGFGVLRFMSPDEGVRAELAPYGHTEVTINNLSRSGVADPASVLAPAAESPGPNKTAVGRRLFAHGIDLRVAEGQFHVDWTYSTNQFRGSTIAGYLDTLVGTVRGELSRRR